YLGGGFSTVGPFVSPTFRRNVAAVDLAGTPTAWNASTDDFLVSALAANASNVYYGGLFARPLGLYHPNLANAGASAARTDVPAHAPGLGLLATSEPNPFTRSARIHLVLPAARPVTAELLDLAGRRVRVLLRSSLLPAGSHDIDMSGTGLAAGMYLCRIEAGEWSRTVKVVHAR